VKPLLLLTGGTGTVGQLLLADLRRDYRLRITSQTAPKPCVINAVDDLVIGDLQDESFARHCVDGSDVVIHLAANASPAASTGEAMGNVDMAAKLFDAATEARVACMVVASSVHASGLDYRDGAAGINPLDVPRPCCPYGASKIAVEALARLHQHAADNSVSCLRLGLTGWPLIEQQYAQTWLSTADLIRLVRAAVNRPSGFGIYNGVSVDSATRWDTDNAREDLGWTPQDRWRVDVDQLPLAPSCPCKMFSVPATAPFVTGIKAYQPHHTEPDPALPDATTRNSEK
jgi:uronate dehydrogenase